MTAIAEVERLRGYVDGQVLGRVGWQGRDGDNEVNRILLSEWLMGKHEYMAIWWWR